MVGLGSDKLTIYSPHLSDPAEVPEIRAVLRAAFENFILAVGGYANATELAGDGTTLSLLKAKGQRMGCAIEGQSAFARIQEISGVPDIGSAFGAKHLSGSQILDLRNTRQCQSLREWFEAGSPRESSDDTIRRFVETLGRPSWVDRLPAKLIRFASTRALSAIEPVTGAAASLVNTFFLSKWFPLKSPRVFLQHAKVVVASSHPVGPPVMQGRGRNAQCPCGSGLKFKKCHGRTAL